MLQITRLVLANEGALFLHNIVLFKWANPVLYLFIFVLFTLQFRMTNIQFEQYKLKKSIDGVLGTRTQGSKMEGADKSTELWRHPIA